MKTEKEKTQGSLEYLIIIAAVLAIAAISVLFFAGTFSSTKQGGDVSKCLAATSKCYNEKATSAQAQCSYCEEACEGLSACKVVACEEGDIEKISTTEEEEGICSTFSFYDDFSENQLNSEMWVVSNQQDKVSLSNGYLIIGSDSNTPVEENEGEVESTKAFEEGFVEFKAVLVDNAPEEYEDGTYHNYAYFNLINVSENIQSNSGFEFLKLSYPSNSLLRASDKKRNTAPEAVETNANQGLFEEYLKQGIIPLSYINPEEEHTYTITWKKEGGGSKITYYIDCRKVMESTTSLAYPRKIKILGNYKQLKIDWIRTCGR